MQRIAQLNARYEHEYADPENWVVYEPLLAHYKRDIAPYLDFQLTPYLEGAGDSHTDLYGQMRALLSRYAQGNLTIEGCAREMNRISAQMGAETVTQGP